MSASTLSPSAAARAARPALRLSTRSTRRRRCASRRGRACALLPAPVPGLSQKPGADISRSISSSALRAEARSKIAPDEGQSAAELVDFFEVSSFMVSLGVRCMSSKRDRRLHRLRIDSDAHLRRSPISTTPHAIHANQSPNRTYGVMRCPRLELRVDDAVAAHRDRLEHAAGRDRRTRRCRSWPARSR